MVPRSKEVVSPEVKREPRTPTGDNGGSKAASAKVAVKKEEEKRRGRKRINPEDKSSNTER